MPDILHDLPVQAPIEKVFDAVAMPRGLDAWWTLRSAGGARTGAIWELFFGDEYDWRGTVSRFEFGRLIEWTMTRSDPDWQGTRVGIELTPIDGGTRVEFWHCGWREANAHYRTSSFCWAMYLRLLKKHCETDDIVPYDRRLEA
jgi:uncharacterized protein YndB with AHSA1/START domain